MVVATVQVVDATAFPWRRSYDVAEFQRHADEALMHAHPGDVVRLIVGHLEPAPLRESFAWVRPDLIYTVEGHPRVTAAWSRALEDAEGFNSSSAAGGEN